MPSNYTQFSKDRDVIISGRYQVPRDEKVRRNFPLKESGSTGGGSNPIYTKYRGVVEYDDTDSEETCIGTSEDHIKDYDVVEASDLRDIETRHFARDVAVCQFGVRRMVNKDTVTVNTGEDVMPYPGGFKKRTSGKARLGTVAQGPIPSGETGDILVNIASVLS